MRKKIFVPNKAIIVGACMFLLILIFVSFGECIYLLINAFSHVLERTVIKTVFEILKSFGCFLFAALLSYQIAQYVCYTIVLDKDKIYIHEDVNTKRKKIQYYTCVKYIDIQSVGIIWSNRKSNGKKSCLDSITAGVVEIPYLSIYTKTGTQELFMIYFTSKKKVRKIIIELINRVNECGNMIETIDVDSIVNVLSESQQMDDE